MIKKILFYAFLIFCFFSKGQVLEKYPEGQLAYSGGYVGYYKDFHNIIIEKQLQPCENKNEIYLFNILILPDGTINFIKDYNQKNLNANKCAYDLARKVALYQKGWIPAKVNGINQSAVARFIIYPDDFFTNYYENYHPSFTPPVYNYYTEGNMDRFRKDIKNKIDLTGFSWNDIFIVESEFIITKEGKMQDIIITKSSGLYKFDERIIMGLKSVKKRWKPALINGTPIDFRVKFTLKGITDLE